MAPENTNTREKMGNLYGPSAFTRSRARGIREKHCIHSVHTFFPRGANKKFAPFRGIKNTESQTNIRKIKNGPGRFQSTATALKFGRCNPLSSMLTLAMHKCLELDLTKIICLGFVQCNFLTHVGCPSRRYFVVGGEIVNRIQCTVHMHLKKKHYKLTSSAKCGQM